MVFNFKEHRLLREFLTSTRISEINLDKMLKELKIITFYTERGETISKEDYENLIKSENFQKYYKETLKYELERYNNDQNEKIKDYFEENIYSELEVIKKYLDDLENHHNTIIVNYDLINDETAENAACLLFIKTFSMFRTIIVCLEKRLLCANVYFRPLNEALNLAKFFLLTKNTEKGKEILFEWFRNNKTPYTKEIVSILKEFAEKHSDEKTALVYSSMNFELSQATSNVIHNSFIGIKEHLIFKFDQDNILLKTIEYEGTSNLREILNNVYYLDSLLLSVYLSYIMCFELLIPGVNKEILMDIVTKRKELQTISNESMKKMDELRRGSEIVI